MTTDRHSKLLPLLLSQGQTSANDIAASLGASLATIRRDQQKLEEQGQIERTHVERTHGAARIATGSCKVVAHS